MPVLRNGTSGADYFSGRDFGGSIITFNPFDTLVGGAGDDIYDLSFGAFAFGGGIVPAMPAVIVEAPGGGWDKVGFGYAPGSYGYDGASLAVQYAYQIPAGVEEASATAVPYYSITGNSLGNLIRVAGYELQAFQNAGYGGGGNDLLTGQLDNFALHGEAGDDILHIFLRTSPGWDMQAEVSGGSGRDLLVIGSGNPHAGIVFSLAAQGTVQALPGGSTVLATGIEDLWVADAGHGTLPGGHNDTLTGNGADNMIIAEAGNDSVNGGNGNDLLFGDRPSDIGLGRIPQFEAFLWALAYSFSQAVPAGADTLLGGNGADTLVGGGAADLLLGGDGDDLIIGHHLPVNPHLPFRYAPAEEIAYANQEDGAADTLRGGAGADTLDGGAGADRMQGETGDDTYILDNPGDRAIELADQGFDTVLTFLLTTRLAANLEALVLLDGAVTGIGNELANRITGNAGDNRLDGGEGADTLIGGAGRDTLTGGAGADVLLLRGPGDGQDRVIGFVSGEDSFAISAAGFGGGLVAGGTLAGRFFAGALPPGTPGGAFLYDQPTGRLWWDANGSAAGERTLLLVLDAGTALAATDFTVIA
jgi:Ca2+-binding RTX toxin-like protein